MSVTSDKTIVILSEESDISTNEVISWIFNIDESIKIVRHNTESYYSNIYVSISDNCKGGLWLDFDQDKNYLRLETSNKVHRTVFWYRRGEIKICSEDSCSIPQLSKYIDRENRAIERFIHRLFGEESINKFADNYIDKLTQLRLASKAGLNIPYSEVLTCKSDLKYLLNRYPELITKAIYHGVSIKTPNFNIFGYTSRFSSSDLEDCPESFSPTLFQEEVSKRYELRIFFLKGTYYSSAVLGSANRNLPIDVRLNDTSEYRTIPYQLPNEIENRLTNLMRMLSLNSGSIDMIVSKDNKYIFLEVNPIGRFGQVSKPCNYYLEQKVAQTLISMLYETIT